MDAETLRALGFEPEELKEQVVQALAARLYNDMKHDVRDEAKQRASTQIDAEVSGLVADVLSAKFVPVNKWGERVGEETTLRDMVIEKLTNFWEQRVDGKGEPTHDRYRTQTRAEWMIGNLITPEIKRQVEQELAKVWNDEIKALRATLMAWIEQRFTAGRVP